MHGPQQQAVPCRSGERELQHRLGGAAGVHAHHHLIALFRARRLGREQHSRAAGPGREVQRSGPDPQASEAAVAASPDHQ
ncbi:hypothetical protein O1G21_05225 [Kitasatospora cathayae]|uniref:Uncharacterized protein n=1 Tax=Kitasatospora cathayae TaxID=3004092 RepID=A0ABY7PY22_9ACTN|nr:hypothetical protein [Kitasatospora sp. HUAS 3-15]WBP85320.1 hypothetical protein O1G21_05225 [Kitasatospora sp. HUAS 3-15]